MSDNKMRPTKPTKLSDRQVTAELIGLQVIYRLITHQWRDLGMIHEVRDIEISPASADPMKVKIRFGQMTVDVEIEQQGRDFQAEVQWDDHVYRCTARCYGVVAQLSDWREIT